MSGLEAWLLSRVNGAKLGARAQRVLDFLITQPQQASYASASDIARRVGVNAATAVRLARQLGFESWPGLQQELRSRYLASLSATEVFDVHAPSAEATTASLRRDLANMQLAMRTVEPCAVQAIADAIAQARRTVVVGSGSFAALGVHLAHIGTQLGYDVVLQRHGGTHLAAAIGRLAAGDVLIAVNFWRLPREILRTVALASELGIVTCVITDMSSSPLAPYAAHLLVVPSEGVSTFPSLVSGMAVVDAVLAELAQRDPARTQGALRRTEDLWRRLELIQEVDRQ